MSRGVDTELFTPAKRTRTDAGINIGYVGRLSPEKSVRVLAAVERALEADCPGVPVRMTIVGDGHERGWLEQHLHRATLTGVLRNDALAVAYADMDLFVFPSQTETVGNVVCEALASGVGVVAMAQGGPRFVAGSSGAVVLAADHPTMIDAVRALVRDHARRESMRVTAREWALGRSWDPIFDGVFRAYATAVSSTVARPVRTRSGHRAAPDPFADAGRAPAIRFERTA
jgi:glycosyltransferase involved in cell wall biosynthesis